ncbi:MAG: zinc-ribbon domain-containing protein [Chloroflexota bacterium]|nr:zinc-ribbon domain-containing protein [Chloroflexota bacterium]
MSQQCPNCGSPVQAGHRFCANCGYSQVSAPTLPISPAGPDVPGTSETATDSTPPVTYVVQRYDTPTPTPEVEDHTPAAPNTGLPVRVVGAEQQEQPYPAFVPPPLPSEQAKPQLSETPRGSIPPPPPPRSLDVSQIGAGSSTYGNFSSASGPRLQGGAFAPYEGGAVRQLERQGSQRTWLMPVLVAGIAALVLLMLGGGYLLLSRQQPEPQPQQQPSNVNVAEEEERLKETVRISNDEQIKAWRDLDTEVLKGTRVGDVLQENIEMIEMLKQNNMYAVPVMERLDFVDVKVNGDTATVRTIETWSVTFYNRDTRQVVRKNGPDTLHETYYMVKQNGKWMVNELVIEESPNAPGSTT